MIVKSRLNGSLKNTGVKSRADYLRIQQKHNHNRVNVAPINTEQPTITSTSVPEDNATVSNGEWESSETVTYSYQWMLDGIEIIGATTNLLILLLAWVGQTITCVVRATNRFGSSIKVSTSIVVAL